MTERINRRKRNAELMATRRTDPSYRILEQNADTNRRRVTRQTNPPEMRAQDMKGMLKLWQQDVLLIKHTE
jgi:hypothetical protein